MKLAPSDICTACMACVDVCNHAAITICLDKEGFYSVNANPEKCVDCGLCSRVCPVLTPLPVSKDRIDLSLPYAAWCLDENLRSKSASGGAFAAIAKLFLEKGGVVYGAVIDGFRIRHKRVDSINSLPLLLGSKYQHSQMDGIYHAVLNDLKCGKLVLFSGLSCQTSGVLKFVGEKLRDRLFTIDTICGGVSTMLPMINLQRAGQYTGIQSYRNKDNGWRSHGFKYSLRMMKNDNMIVDLGQDNMMLKCFCNKLMKRSSCLDCSFNGFHRVSDVTIGDFWGDTRFPSQHKNGLSVMVIHSSRISSFINEADITIEPISWKELIQNNPSYYWAHYSFLRRYSKRKKILHCLYRGDEQRAKRLLENDSFFNRLILFIPQRLNEKNRNCYLKQLFKDI